MNQTQEDFQFNHKVEKLAAEAMHMLLVPSSRSWLSIDLAREVVWYIISNWGWPPVDR